MSVRIIIGDARERLKTLPDQSVHCCVTSPPYFGLRDYGTAKWDGGDSECDHKQGRPGAGRADGIVDERAQRNRDGVGSIGGDCKHCGAVRIDSQIGLEATPDAFVAEMVAVFREVRRVLRNDGTLWLNLGDSYASSGGITHGKRSDGMGQANESEGLRRPGRGDLKHKDLMGIPWRVAFALQADGWYLRQDIIWSKPNPMPESVTDRCTKAHEYIFLMSKNARYHYDAVAIAESLTTDPRENYPARAKITGRGDQGAAEARGNDQDKSGGFPPRMARASGNKTHKGVTEYKNSDSEEHRTKSGLLKISDTIYHTRNKRSVWTVATAPFSEAHFATFPPDLIEPCIKAGCPIGGTVLDPFGGAGTTALVADRLGRDAILIELNPGYAAMAKRRIEADAPLFSMVGVSDGAA